MQKNRRTKIKWQFFLLFLCASCAGLYKDFDKKVLDSQDFEKQVQITQIPDATQGESVDTAAVAKTTEEIKKEETAHPKKTQKNKKKLKNKKATGHQQEETATNATIAPTEKSMTHLPEIEDGDGFQGRRPIQDPFREGELAIYSVSYFGVEAGRLNLGIKPYVQVNGRKSYHFEYTGKTSSVFSMFYAVDDQVHTYMDYESLVPTSYTLHVKESKQVREVRNYFNLQKMRAYMWDKRQKKGEPLEDKQYDWEILPYSQNVFTAAFYLRVFTFKVGKEFNVRIAHEGKNMVMKAKVLREEKISTPVGSFDAWVLKPEIQVGGIFQPTGDIYFWVSKDDRKHILRIESKIKIGTIVARLEQLTP